MMMIAGVPPEEEDISCNTRRGNRVAGAATAVSVRGGSHQVSPRTSTLVALLSLFGSGIQLEATYTVHRNHYSVKIFSMMVLP